MFRGFSPPPGGYCRAVGEPPDALNSHWGLPSGHTIPSKAIGKRVQVKICKFSLRFLNLLQQQIGCPLLSSVHAFFLDTGTVTSEGFNPALARIQYIFFSFIQIMDGNVVVDYM